MASITCMTCGTSLKMAVGDCPVCSGSDWGPTPPGAGSRDAFAAMLSSAAAATSARDALRSGDPNPKRQLALEQRLRAQDRLLADRIGGELDPDRRARLIHARFRVQQQLSD